MLWLVNHVRVIEPITTPLGHQMIWALRPYPCTPLIYLSYSSENISQYAHIKNYVQFQLSGFFVELLQVAGETINIIKTYILVDLKVGGQ